MDYFCDLERCRWGGKSSKRQAIKAASHWNLHKAENHWTYINDTHRNVLRPIRGFIEMLFDDLCKKVATHRTFVCIKQINRISNRLWGSKTWNEICPGPSRTRDTTALKSFACLPWLFITSSPTPSLQDEHLAIQQGKLNKTQDIMTFPKLPHGSSNLLPVSPVGNHLQCGFHHSTQLTSFSSFSAGWLPGNSAGEALSNHRYPDLTKSLGNSA